MTRTYVVISKADNTTMGPFATEVEAIDWAKSIRWQNGYVVRTVHPIAQNESAS